MVSIKKETPSTKEDIINLILKETDFILYQVDVQTIIFTRGELAALIFTKGDTYVVEIGKVSSRYKWGNLDMSIRFNTSSELLSILKSILTFYKGSDR